MPATILTVNMTLSCYYVLRSYPDLESHFKVFSHVSIKDFHIQIEVEPVVDIGGILVTKEERRGENLSPR